MNSGPEKFRPRPQSLLIFAALLLGLGISIALTTLPLNALRIAAHLGVAALLGALIAAFFMNLREAGALIRVFALGGLLWLAFMFVLFPADWLTR